MMMTSEKDLETSIRGRMPSIRPDMIIGSVVSVTLGTRLRNQAKTKEEGQELQPKRKKGKI